ncbi:MAG: response regulator transcription factor, partial [Anaerolineales bacterium]|nr:response regulator transcription factor [Anaerolineales bacterium]
HLAQTDAQISFQIEDNSVTPTATSFSDTQSRIIHLGGEINSRQGEGQGLAHTIQFQLTPPVQFTAREMELLRLLAQGMSNKEMAQALDISPRTINFHLDNIYSKLGVRSRTEAAVYALRQQLIE